jgi:hypothetical protein
VDDRFFESISAGLWAADSLDHFGPVLCFIASAAALASLDLIAVFAAFAMTFS